MRIRTKTTILGGVATVSIAVLILVSVAIQYSAFEVERRFESLQATISDIRLVDELAAEAVYKPGERIQRQWNAQIAKVRETFDRLFDGLDLSAGFKGEVEGRLNTIDRTIRRLSDSADAMTPAMRAALTTRLNSNRNALFGQIERIEAKLISERQQLLMTSVIALASTVLITSALIGFSVFTLRKTLFDSMRDINYGVRGLAPGQRANPIETTRVDEIGTILKELEAVRVQIERAFAKEEEARLQAEELSAAKSNFVATTSHELRTPLNGLLGCVSVLEETGLDEEQANLVKMARSSGESLLSIINDVLDFSKIETGSLELDFVPFQPGPVLRQVGATYAILAEKRGLDLIVEITIEDTECLIGDPARVRQVVSNLVDNAVKFTKEGLVRIDGTLQREDAQGRRLLEITITDTGIGIAPDKHGPIFEPFQQEESSTTRRFGGSGLGLAISKKLTELMGGAITVRSAPGEGAAFTVSLALTPVEGPDLESLARSDHSDLHDSLPGLAVLVVDDVDINRIVVAEMIKKWGCVVHEASDGFEALAAVQEHAPEIVLMDVQMPGMDGVEATRQLRFSGNRIPVIGLTANAFNNQRREYLAAGMDQVVPKPVDWRELYTAMTTAGKEGEDDGDAPLPPRHSEEIGPPPPKFVEGTVLEGLKSVMSGEKLRSLCHQTLARVHDTLDTLGEDPPCDEDLRDSGHTMKGMCGNLGFIELSRLGAQLEDEGAQCDLTSWSEEVRGAMSLTERQFERIFS